jgi:hypothetical protein
MPLASYPFGVGPFGEDPVQTSDPAVQQTPPAAIYLDLGTQDAKVEDGLWTSMHPVDQAVQLSFGVRRGTLRSAPDVGHQFDLIRVIGNTRFEGDVRAATRDAFPFSRLVTDGSITHLDTVIQRGKSGEFRVLVSYVNNKLPRSPGQKPQTAQYQSNGT